MDIKEREVKHLSGYLMLFLLILLAILAIGSFILSFFVYNDLLSTILMAFFIISIILIPILSPGFKTVKPNSAYVLTLFGKYVGTLKKEGFFYVNPFSVANDGYGSRRSVSLRIQSLVNSVQKVNDKMGNPIMVGAVVIWRVVDATKAVFVVDEYEEFLSNQADSIIRNVARLYPYDSMSDLDESDDELTLRGSSEEIANRMERELQEAVKEAGLEIIEVRINQLSYAEEIAQAMLQRQQAVAIIAARRKIVEGAVSMVDMALKELKDGDIVSLDDREKAQMVSNLLVVLCGNKDAQPVVNSSSL